MHDLNIRIVTASAGTGKTTHLCHLLQEAVATRSARPEAIVATTFTKQAAAELLNRARSALLRAGQGRAAEALMTARLGTVNAVCGGIVSDFALELGLSPELRVLDENGAELELIRALAGVVDPASAEQLDRFKDKFDREFDWHYEVKRIIETARANGMSAADLPACALRSQEALDACLGPVSGTASDLDGGLLAALDAALAGIAGGADKTSGTADYVDCLEECRRHLRRGNLRWGNWAKLAGATPTKKSLAFADGVQTAAATHRHHPRLRAEMHTLIAALFGAAAAGMAAYQEHKSALGLLDYVDQEVLALQALRNEEIRAALAGKFDLVLVDEFQDTSPLQLTIFLELARLAKESVWVGDPKQAIYGFRGTDPALMDAAIESLTNPRDPDLVAAVADRVAGSRPVETLSVSYRSRPPLVDVTNEIFARAFNSQGMPEGRTRVSGALAVDPPELGPAFAQWPLEGRNKIDFAQALAAGVTALLAGKPHVRDRQTGQPRPATLADVAILCRTNAQCTDVAEALGQQGLAAVVARVGLLDTAEAHVLVAGLRLWVDPRDRLAASLLHRILECAEDGARLASELLTDSAPALGALAESPAVKAVLEARTQHSDADVMGAVDAVLGATDLRRLCAEWGNSAQRTANLDALRAHAHGYCEERQASRDTPSLVGLLRALQDLVPGGWDWGNSRSDRCALLAGQDAIRVSTWHAAKGLEWSMVVLYGLETMRPPLAYGVHVMTDRETFDLADPLAGRWIRFWPNPYTNSVQNGAVKDAYETSGAFDEVVKRAEREALRVLYVGWTRARDNLILAAQKGKLLGGLLGTLRKIDAGLICDPAVGVASGGGVGDGGGDREGDREGNGDGPAPRRNGVAHKLVQVAWAGRAVEVDVRPCAGNPPVPPSTDAGRIRTVRAPAAYAPARATPSSAAGGTFTVGESFTLGAPILWTAKADANVMGTTVHAFFAADSKLLTPTDREDLAAQLLQRHGVAAALSAAALVNMADRLWAWADTRFPGAKIRREWPLSQRLAARTVMTGTADLVIEAADHLAIIDHKSGGSLEAALAKADIYSAQLASYAEATIRAGWAKPLSTWVHLPFAGRIVAIASSPPTSVLDRRPEPAVL